MMKELHDLADNAQSRQLSTFADGHHMDTFTQPGYYDVTCTFPPVWCLTKRIISQVVRKWLQKVFEGEKSSKQELIVEEEDLVEEDSDD